MLTRQDMDGMRKLADEPSRNNEGWYSCSCGEDMRELIAEIERLQVSLKVATEADSQRVGYWVWQGDGHDHLESIMCPIMIHAEDMRGLIAEIERLQDQSARLAAIIGDYQAGRRH